MKTVVLLALGTLSGLSSSFAAETKVRIEDLPAGVKTAMKEQIKGATIVGARKEREHGRVTYEVETKLNGKGRDLTFARNGSLLEVEQEVDLDSIPDAAKEAIQTRAAGGRIKKIESVTQGSSTSYEADVQSVSGKNVEVAVNADGSPHRED